jgi:ketosteroid isomerase-like protein
MWFRAISAIAAMGLALPAFASPVDHQSTTEIDKLVTSYTEQFNHHDVASVGALFTADAVIVATMASSMGVTVADGHDAVTKYLDTLFQKGTHLDGFTEDQISQIRHNVVMLVGQWHATGDSNGGPYNLMGRWTAVAVRLNHGWQFRLLTVFPNPPTGS